MRRGLAAVCTLMLLVAVLGCQVAAQAPTAAAPTATAPTATVPPATALAAPTAPVATTAAAPEDLAGPVGRVSVWGEVPKQCA